MCSRTSARCWTAFRDAAKHPDEDLDEFQNLLAELEVSAIVPRTGD